MSDNFLLRIVAGQLVVCSPVHNLLEIILGGIIIAIIWGDYLLRGEPK